MRFNQSCGLQAHTSDFNHDRHCSVSRGPVRQVGGALCLSAPIKSLLALSPLEIKGSRLQIIELDSSRHSAVPRESRDNTDRVNGSKNGAIGSLPTNLQLTSCQLLCTPILSPVRYQGTWGRLFPNQALRQTIESLEPGQRPVEVAPMYKTSTLYRITSEVVWDYRSSCADSLHGLTGSWLRLPNPLCKEVQCKICSPPQAHFPLEQYQHRPVFVQAVQ